MIIGGDAFHDVISAAALTCSEIVALPTASQRDSSAALMDNQENSDTQRLRVQYHIPQNNHSWLLFKCFATIGPPMIRDKRDPLRGVIEARRSSVSLLRRRCGNENVCTLANRAARILRKIYVYILSVAPHLMSALRDAIVFHLLHWGRAISFTDLLAIQPRRIAD